MLHPWVPSISYRAVRAHQRGYILYALQGENENHSQEVFLYMGHNVKNRHFSL